MTCLLWDNSQLTSAERFDIWFFYPIFISNKCPLGYEFEWLHFVACARLVWQIADIAKKLSIIANCCTSKNEAIQKLIRPQTVEGTLKNGVTKKYHISMRQAWCSDWRLQLALPARQTLYWWLTSICMCALLDMLEYHLQSELFVSYWVLSNIRRRYPGIIILMLFWNKKRFQLHACVCAAMSFVGGVTVAVCNIGYCRSIIAPRCFVYFACCFYISYKICFCGSLIQVLANNDFWNLKATVTFMQVPVPSCLMWTVTPWPRAMLAIAEALLHVAQRRTPPQKLCDMRPSNSRQTIK